MPRSRSTPAPGSDTAKNLYWGSTWYIWNNGGDTATLENANGVKVDSCTYTAARTRARPARTARTAQVVTRVT